MERPTVLLAEDQPGLRRLLGGVLRGAGYEVVEAADAQALCERLAAWQAGDPGFAPDVIISDLHTAASELDALRRLRALERSTPVVVLSAFTDFATLREALALGATHVFNKPFDVHHVLATLRRLVGSPPPPLP